MSERRTSHRPRKPGAKTLAEAEARFGPLPPTVTSTSRDDGVSGIRLFRVPAGSAWRDLGDDVETIHAGWRYVVAAPSAHPEGRAYRWLDADGNRLDNPPRFDTLPELPAAWIEELRAGPAGDIANPVSDPEAEAFLVALPEGEPCQVLLRVLDDAAGVAR